MVAAFNVVVGLVIRLQLLLGVVLLLPASFSLVALGGDIGLVSLGYIWLGPWR